jgi:hypothetical protein
MMTAIAVTICASLIAIGFFVGFTFGLFVQRKVGGNG